jgi:hypothetical protein
MARHFVLVLLACAWLVPSLRAHDPFLAEIETENAADTFILRVLLARPVAAHLAGLTANPRLYFAPADFAAHQADFDRVARGLCVVSAGDRPIEAAKTEATLSKDEEEVVFTLTYPRPAVNKVRLDCVWLSHLPEGYAASTRRGAGSSGYTPKLTRESPSAYLHLPVRDSPAPAP